MDGFDPGSGFEPELSCTLEELLQQQQYQQGQQNQHEYQLPQQQQQQQQQQPEGSGSFKLPPDPTRLARLSKEERTERKDRYDRIEYLTRELSLAVRDEMARRKELWDIEGDREEEEFWESRKQEVFKGLEKLAGEIQRAFRDRRKEAVLEMWSKENEERKTTSRATSKPERGREGPRRDEV